VIYPTRRAVLLMAAGAPLALALALAAPGMWSAALAWIAVVVLLAAADAWLAAPIGSVGFSLEAPTSLSAVGAAQPAVLGLAFAGRAPPKVEGAIEVNGKLTASPARAAGPVEGRRARLAFELRPVRRGEGRIERAWARWSGPLGLMHVQAREVLDRPAPVIPNIQQVHEEAVRLFARDAEFGQKRQRDLGDGTEFNALREHQVGMDLRNVDWKQSARHGVLLSKEFNTDRNHPIMLAIDSGRLMGEPVGGAPKLDRAINAALLLGYVSLRMGDRVGLSAFDSHPRVIGRTAAGARAFPTIQRLAAQVDYSEHETNFVLGLSAVTAALDRRALVVVFTDFADTISAQLLLETAGRIAKRHLVLFALFTDEELETIARQEPAAPADVSRAVVADALLRERELTIAKLRRMGAEVVEAPPERFGPAIVDRYLALKRKDRL
jgi:uncharacterized protein (DUF58 family)